MNKLFLAEISYLAYSTGNYHTITRLVQAEDEDQAREKARNYYMDQYNRHELLLENIVVTEPI